jgi:hypothetical protein
MPTLTKTCLCLLSSALLLLNACKREPEPQKYLGNYPLGEVKDYLYFKPGSYWVYECDSTGELDSQVMVSIDTPWFHKSYIDYQVLFFIRKSITHNVVFSTDNFYDVPYNSNFSYFDAYNINISGNGTSAYDCVFFYPFDSLKYGYGSSPTYYKGYLDSLQVLGKWYKEVRVFQVQYAGGFVEPRIKTWGDGQITYYWAKNIGVVRVHVWTKKDGFDTTFKFNWNLKRYFIP